jgi:hypothetical protein
VLLETGTRPQQARILAARHVNFDEMEVRFADGEVDGKPGEQHFPLTKKGAAVLRKLCLQRPEGTILRNSRNKPCPPPRDQLPLPAIEEETPYLGVQLRRRPHRRAGPHRGRAPAIVRPTPDSRPRPKATRPRIKADARRVIHPAIRLLADRQSPGLVAFR